MLFNSIDFAIFFPIVFLLFWLIFYRRIWLQNTYLLVVSYVFYAWWDWRFLLLIVASSITDYIVGIFLGKEEDIQKRRKWVAVSLVVNLTILFVFKYFDFFVDSFITAFSLFGLSLASPTITFLLPVGISFYTLQTLSYTFDIYRGKISPTKNILAFFSFVAFFPQLVAGPIERAERFLPQFFEKKKFSYDDAKDGLKHIAWGLFKKIAVADVLAVQVTYIFSNYETMSSGMLLLGAVYFAVQVYADFSGYSDIAIGIARMLGFNLMTNFKYPFFARDIAELWRRWHISLTTWFRDYVYIPLGGSRVSRSKQVRNICIVFVLSGLWHGAAAHYLVWGVLAIIPYLPLMLSQKNRRFLDTVAANRTWPTVKEGGMMIGAFLGFALPLIMFRSESVRDGFMYMWRLVSDLQFTVTPEVLHIAYVIPVLFLFEWFHRTKEHPLQLTTRSRLLRTATYFFVCYFTIAHISNEANPFIYFQF